MPRIPGQIDVAKTEAILDAAVEVIGERGLKDGLIEYQGRRDDAARTIPAAEISEFLTQLLAK